MTSKMSFLCARREARNLGQEALRAGLKARKAGSNPLVPATSFPTAMAEVEMEEIEMREIEAWVKTLQALGFSVEVVNKRL